jgi:hypothetical protein
VFNEWAPPSQRTGSKRKTQSPHGPTLSQVRVSPTAPRCVSFDALRYTCAAPLAAEESTDRAEDHANESPQSENRVIPGGTSGMNRTLSFAATEESLFANSGISTADFEFLKVVGDGYYGKVRSRSTLPRRSWLDGTNLRLVTTPPVSSGVCRQAPRQQRDLCHEGDQEGSRRPGTARRSFSLRTTSIAAHGKGMPRQSKKAKLAQTERNIMQKLKHPFIMSIYYAFQTQSAPCVLSRLTPVRAHSCV